MGLHIDLRSAQRARHARVALARVGTNVVGEVKAACAELRGQRRKLALGAPAADHQVTVPLPQGAVEILQALEQKLGPRP